MLKLIVDCLSQQLDMSAPQETDDKVQIVLVSSQLPDTIKETLEQKPMVMQSSSDGIGEEQLKLRDEEQTETFEGWNITR